MTSESTARGRWDETWRLTGSAAPAEQLRTLLSRYRERHRAYHNLRHVLQCLDWAAAVRSELNIPSEVELALWYHDTIYEPRAADNEERSALLAATELSSLPAATVASITALIMATKHQDSPAGHDAQFLVDIDLSILGSPAEAFAEYEAAIRREYRWVPGPLFRRKRREVLQGFLNRPRIFSTDHFHTLLEATARVNLARSVAQLS